MFSGVNISGVIEVQVVYVISIVSGTIVHPLNDQPSSNRENEDETVMTKDAAHAWHAGLIGAGLRTGKIVAVRDARDCSYPIEERVIERGEQERRRLPATRAMERRMPVRMPVALPINHLDDSPCNRGSQGKGASRSSRALMTAYLPLS